MPLSPLWRAMGPSNCWRSRPLRQVQDTLLEYSEGQVTDGETEEEGGQEKGGEDLKFSDDEDGGSGWWADGKTALHRQYEDPAKLGWVTIGVHSSVHAAPTEHQG